MPTARTRPSREDGTLGASLLTGSWLTCGKEGLFSAYAPAEGAVLRWTEGRSGWSEPDRLAHDGLTADLTVAQGVDRYVHLVGIRRTGVGDEVELTHAVQFQTGRPVLGWTSLGHPNRTGPWTGHPAAAVDADGRLCVFVRNGGGGVSCRVQNSRGWGGWQDLGGARTGDFLAAAADGAGRVQLFVPGARAIRWFTQEEDGGKFVLSGQLDAVAAPGAFTALATSSGSVSLYFLDGGGIVNVWAPGRSPYAQPLVQAAGAGPLVATRAMIGGYDCTVLAQESGPGRVSFTAHPTEQESAGAWWSETDTGAPSVMPAVCTGTHGRMVAAALADRQQLWLTRQKASDEGFLLDKWTKKM
ncbi:hypothetical protein ABZY06_19515 [Streptomyces sp. NPDC006540]|uniref:hypothetical protein n=1 Tax=Streptomyces sp. NPDC006540 TaxID=3155353 RepID=UPI0033B10EC4